MTVFSEKHEEIRQYLLGSLSEAFQQRIEERLLTEGGFLEELEMCEAELIDDYVNDELDADNRAKFEQHFLCTPDRLQKLKFAMALGRYTSQPAVSPQTEPLYKRVAAASSDPGWSERLSALWNVHAWAFRAAMTLAVIVIIAVVVWVSLPRAPRTVATLNLSISTSERGQGTPATRVNLPLNADALRITLKLPDTSVSARDFRVELLDGKGSAKRVEVEGRDGQSLSIVLRESQLVRGDYALNLFMIKPDGIEQRVNGSYYFTVQ